uniref:Cytochrome b6-f complex subunit 6 n=1 Tax=Chloropicon sp. RCC4434 TaxID=2565277 RepID=A0A4D6C5U3_9CHLO|nr:subunit VI of cytochrome b6/f complex [Chloropicon sp. RCC4434]
MAIIGYIGFLTFFLGTALVLYLGLTKIKLI